MARRCTICDHQARAQIEAEIVAGTDSQETIAKRYGMTRRCVGWHLTKHMEHPEAYATKAQDVPLELTGDPGTDAQTLLQECARILHDARKRSNIDTQIKAADSVGKKIELIAKMLGAMPPDTEIQILQVIVNDGSKTGTVEFGRPEQLLPG